MCAYACVMWVLGKTAIVLALLIIAKGGRSFGCRMRERDILRAKYGVGWMYRSRQNDALQLQFGQLYY